ncbi:hypothetical protein ACFP81_05390 [Deinococcus lacus]|uniref:Uncharacterized protein n=1 Tax=Deinococcus lacus TaxID=392561 RepID=A0ABW1YBV9_9DEIO
MNDTANREAYFTRRTRRLLGLEFLLGGAGMALLLLAQGAALLLGLGLLLSLAGLLMNAWRNVQRFHLMDEYEQLTMLKGMGVAFIALMCAAFMGGLTLFFLAPALDTQTLGMALLTSFLLAHAVLAAAQSRLAKVPGEPI